MPRIVYYKARPKFGAFSLDLLSTCTAHKKFFMPYPQWNGAPPVLANFRDYQVHLQGRRGRVVGDAQVTKASNLIAAGNPHWAIIPRLGEGLFWVAPILGGYQVWSRAQPWFTSLQATLAAEGVSNSHVCLGDAAQGWDTGNWKSVPIARLPRWFSKQLLSQSSFGTVHPLQNYPTRLAPLQMPAPDVIARDAYGGGLPLVVTGVGHGTGKAPLQSRIQRRLVETMSPTLLELLCVELLQAQLPHLAWMHVAGAGDGGADGVGFDPLSANPIYILQVKWQSSKRTTITPQTTHVAYLVGNAPTVGASVKLWGPVDIAASAYQHWSALSDYFRRALA